MSELEMQSNKPQVNIEISGQTYRLDNSDRLHSDELQFAVSEEIYDNIRESATDTIDIAANLGLKPENVQKVKDHGFYNKHKLDRFVPEEIEYKRLESGTHIAEDITWIKHECAERHHELKYDSGYSEAHDRAQSRYDGFPWED